MPAVSGPLPGQAAGAKIFAGFWHSRLRGQGNGKMQHGPARCAVWLIDWSIGAEKLLYLACLASLPAWAALDADLVAARNGDRPVAAQDSAQARCWKVTPRYWALQLQSGRRWQRRSAGLLQRYADSALAKKLRRTGPSAGARQRNLG